MPLISICIPSYNSEKFIAKTIESILNQSLQDFEIVVCDDGSTDQTAEIVKSYADSRIKLYINEKNLGITGNWNKSVSLATGKYVKLVCGDDILYPQCLEEQTRILEADTKQEIALVVSQSCIINSAGKVLFDRKSKLKVGINESKKVYNKCIASGTNIIGEPMSGLFRRELFSSKISFDGLNQYLIDLDFWFKLLQHGNLYSIHKTHAAFRISNRSLSSKLSFKQPLLYQQFIRKAGKKYHVSVVFIIFGHINSSILGVLRNIVFLFA